MAGMPTLHHRRAHRFELVRRAGHLVAAVVEESPRAALAALDAALGDHAATQGVLSGVWRLLRGPEVPHDPRTLGQVSQPAPPPTGRAQRLPNPMAAIARRARALATFRRRRR